MAKEGKRHPETNAIEATYLEKRNYGRKGRGKRKKNTKKKGSLKNVFASEIFVLLVCIKHLGERTPLGNWK